MSGWREGKSNAYGDELGGWLLAVHDGRARVGFLCVRHGDGLCGWVSLESLKGQMDCCTTVVRSHEG